jgi:hypothetical protein
MKTKAQNYKHYPFKKKLPKNKVYYNTINWWSKLFNFYMVYICMVVKSNVKRKYKIVICYILYDLY